MPTKSLNKNLHAAKNSKKDEFYTQLSDIEKELKHYKDHFKDKVVLCNCDDPRVSNFFHYFSYNFETLGLKKLITTCYKNQNRDLFSEHDSERAIYLEYNGDKNNDKVPNPDEIGIKHLKGDGDFRSDECIELLKEADIVATNPPFSLFREYVAQLIKYDKKFIIIGTQNALHYQEIFKLFKDNKMWLGNGFENGNAFFQTPDGETYGNGVYNPDTGLVKFRNVAWFTNLEHKKRHEDLILFKKYDAEEFPRYDNFDAIEVSKIKDIPVDYFGAMGVPDTFLANYNPDQFELIGIPFGNLGKEIGVTKNHRGRTDIAITKDGKSRCPYSRIIIKRKNLRPQ
ncbi:MAG: adenine-specific methyltransferase EcoRI family protein [Pyrinomonadaceae bacterium]